MTREVREYAEERILESGIRMVPGHYPDFRSREHVDRWLEMSRISREIADAEALVEMGPDEREECLTNQEVSAIFTDLYNGFWMRHRDNLPALHDEAGWDSIQAEARALMKKHSCQLATDIAADLVVIMDQRQRAKEVLENGG